MAHAGPADSAPDHAIERHSASHERHELASEPAAATMHEEHDDMTDTSEATKIKATEIARWLDSEPEPRSRMAIQRGVGGRALLVRAAINALLADPSSGIVEVGPQERGAFRIWTQAHAERAGLHVRAPAELEIDPVPAAAASEAAPPIETSEDPWAYSDGYDY